MSLQKHNYFFLLLFLITGITLGQTTVYSEAFNNGCASNCLLTAYGGGWTVLDNVGGTTGGAPNNWFVSCAEEGITPPGCGSSCIGDACLHIGANAGAGGDMGASYNETGATNATYRMAVSPLINTTGFSGLTLQFDFIAFGSAACSDDRAQLRLSTDGGATWPAGYQYCLTSVCCGACNGYSQGQWTLYSLALPAAFDNNPNVRVGFHWRNNGNGSGTDPSVGIDDVRVTAPTLPLTLIDFVCLKQSNAVKLKWTTASEVNFSRFDLERSSDAMSFKAITSVPGKGSGKEGKTSYSFDDNSPFQDVVYYRLKMIDRDGTVKYSKIISSSGDASQGTLSLVSHVINNDVLKLVVNSPVEGTIALNIFDSQGKLLMSFKDQKVKQGNNALNVDVSSLQSSMYILKISGKDKASGVITEKVVRTK